MKHLQVMLLVCALLMSGCGMTIVPHPVGSAVLNLDDNSISAEKGGITVSARVQDLEVAPYRMANNVTSFHVVVENATAEPFTLPLSSFVLLDEEARQYRPVPPAEIQQIINRDSSYLIPYPYVGYYYLEDREKSAFFNTFDSALPYYAENYPQDIYTEALSADAIIPDAKVSGLVYFIIDLATKTSVELRIYLPGTDPAGPADFVFPFSIEK